MVPRTLGILLLLAMAHQRAPAVDNAWYAVANAPDRLWTTVAGWQYNGGALGRLPRFDDTVTLNSNQTGPDNPIVIPAGYDAEVTNLWIASIAGNTNNYASDGRIPSLTLCGTLQTPSNKWRSTSITVGSAAGGFGLMRIEEGAMITNANLTIGDYGIGIVTNNGGNLFFTPGADRNLTVGGNASGFGTFVQNSGLTKGKMHIGIGEGGTGTVEVAGGEFACENIFVGVTSEASLLIKGGTVASTVSCGWQGNAHGTVEMSGGTLSHSPVIGRNASGEFRFRGGASYIYDLKLGDMANGYGVLDVNSPTRFDVSSSFLCGYNGRGVATLHSGMQQVYFKIGGNTNHVSEVTILDGATNRVGSSVNVGGYPMPAMQNGAMVGTTEHAGCGILTLRGGTVHFYGDSSSVNFFIGRYADGWGCLRGYGKIAPKNPGETNIRIGGGNCIICADGEGVERSLDLNECVNITNYFAEANVATSTNGWYAVNKGRVLFPRTWFSTALTERCIGDYPYAVTPRFVNSMRCSFTGVSGSATFFRGGLYATDCENVPAGLPPGDVIGVWAFGLFNAVDGNSKVSFSTALPTFRYDHTKAKEDRLLNLYRHDGTSWVRIGRTMPNADHLISAESTLAPLSSGSMNIGFFAVVVPKAGMTVLFR